MYLTDTTGFFCIVVTCYIVVVFFYLTCFSIFIYPATALLCILHLFSLLTVLIVFAMQIYFTEGYISKKHHLTFPRKKKCAKKNTLKTTEAADDEGEIAKVDAMHCCTQGDSLSWRRFLGSYAVHHVATNSKETTAFELANTPAGASCPGRLLQYLFGLYY